MIKKTTGRIFAGKKPKQFPFLYRVFPLYNELHVFSKNCNRPEMVRWHWFSF